MTGIQKHIIENKYIRVKYIPKNGGMISSLFDKTKNHEWVWYKNGKNFPKTNDYDSSWRGGWEELFPCDFEERFSWGKSRDHGELWGREWSIVKNGKTWVELQIKSRESNTLFTKKIKLIQNKLFCNYTAQILFDDFFLFKLHLAIPNDNNFINLKNVNYEKVDKNFGNISQETNFKNILLYPKKNTKYFDFFYIKNHKNNIEVINDQSKSKMVLTFDKKTLPHFWLFQSQGGWMNKNTTVLEPSSNSLKLIKDAVNDSGAIKGPIKKFSTWYKVELKDA